MSSLRQLIKSLLTSCLPADRWLTRGPIRRRRQGERPTIALTFDDGPDPVTTPLLLDQLQRYSLPATFFVVGEKAAAHPDLIRRIVAEGHGLAHHSWSHSEPRLTSASQLRTELLQTVECLDQLVGRRSALFRPPKGELTFSKLQMLWRLRQTIVLWNVDPRDFRMQNDTDVTAWAEGYSPRSGDIVLLHDNHPWAGRIVAALADRGVFEQFACARIDEWLSPGRIVETRSRRSASAAGPSTTLPAALEVHG